MTPLARTAHLVAARVRAVPPPVVDLAPAVVAFAAMVATRAATDPGDRLAIGVALSAIVATGLALRRRAPVIGYAVQTGALAVESLGLGPGELTPLVNLMGLYALGHGAARQRVLWGPVIMLPGILAYFGPDDGPALAPAGVVFLWLLVWAAGYTAARRRDAQAEARAEEERRMRQDAVADERTRIARELHDLVGHTLTVMLVRVGAARVVLDRDPGQARDILHGVEESGRAALDELDHVLGVLRPDATPDATPDPTDAQPGLASVPRLVERMAGTGTAVSVRIEPPADALPAGLDRAAYRIVQEALTNALRHGRAASVSVSARCDRGTVELVVSDDGAGPPPGYRPGRGLLGIAERAALFAGTVEHAARDGGGFRVRAVLPLP
ncbi:sensor histidine kinase [Cryptosporangium aurantiacum]|uniref:histidine kinase n=1 Tax=Cryptosporangium aurantiacum TaxID=134849 RepID=A0A1M7RC06_9ACTN|nr:histidine kinase [Cryptosporangium aurantiacum]SHN43746.1 Histidine kinase-, DNA gyrase B-, and HSP90-like ATPase [Cryptosporangium aurantiacum]